MSSDVHISVCFSAEYTDIGTSIAWVALGGIREREKAADGTNYPEAKDMLKAFIGNEGFFCGTKGSLFNWGYVGNYTHADEFVDILKPFWYALLAASDIEPCDFEHILIFEEKEDYGSVTVYEVMYSRHTEQMVVEVHKDLPFCWNQL